MEDALRPLKTGDVVQPGTKLYFKWTSEMCTNLQTWAAENGSESPVLFTVEDEDGHTWGSMDVNIYTIARPTVTVVTLGCTWYDGYEMWDCVDFLTQTWETPWIVPSFGERTSGVVTVFNYLEDYEDAEAVQDIVDHIFVDPSTLYNAESSGSGSEEFGSIVKNGIAYNLIYKNNIQYTMIYLGGNRWWTYGTSSKPNEETGYFRRIMVNDNLNNKTIYLKPGYLGLINDNYGISGNVIDSSIPITSRWDDSNGHYILSYSYSGDEYIIYEYDGGSPITILDTFKLPDNGVSISVTQVLKGEIYESDVPAYHSLYIKDAHVRPLQVGDILTNNTKLYLNFPSEAHQIANNVLSTLIIKGIQVANETTVLTIGEGLVDSIDKMAGLLLTEGTEETQLASWSSTYLEDHSSCVLTLTADYKVTEVICGTFDITNEPYVLVDETTLKPTS